MSPQNKNESSPQMVLDALETLATIADLGSEPDDFLNIPEIEIQGEIFYPIHQIESRRDKVDDITVEKIKDIFQTILNYLKGCCKHKVRHLMDRKMVDGIKAIMSLVGDAAKKLDQHLDLLQGEKNQAVTQLEEYKQLQEFYSKKIEQIVDDRSLSRWIMGLARSTWLHEAEKRLESRHVGSPKQIFVDLDTVKKDTEYELLLIRKADGTRFFSPRLLRNIKLVCDFGGHMHTEEIADALEDVEFWQDVSAHKASQSILQSIEEPLKVFFSEVNNYKERELAISLNKIIMALMLASHSKHLLSHQPLKSCKEYFSDFQMFFRDALKTREFQKLLLYPPTKKDVFSQCMMQIMMTIAKTIYTGLNSIQEMIPHTIKLISEAHQQSGTPVENHEEEMMLWSSMTYDYAAMLKLFKKHANRPLSNILSLLENSGHREFDPLIQGNLPNIWFELQLGDRSIVHLRLPSPTRQGVVNKADISSEFEAFLLSNKVDGEKKHLIINLQDRTSWRENARCHALEHLMHSPSIGKQVQVETMATDTEFYHQMRQYEKMNHAEPFMKQFKENLQGELSGFKFSHDVEKTLSESFISKMFKEIHNIFFENKNTLTKQNRLDFITIVYLFLELKFIEISGADSFSFTCKDGVDQASASTALLFAFLKLLQQKELNKKDVEYLNLILYGPVILIRERIMLPDIFNRTMSALKQIETVRKEKGYEEFSKAIQNSFKNIYHIPLLQARIEYPSIVQPEPWQEAA